MPGRLLLAALLAASCGSNGEVLAKPAPPSPQPAPRAETVGERLERTLAAVREHPDLRVIVRLDVPVESEAELAALGADARIKEQRRTIGQAQNAWLQASAVQEERAAVRTFTTRPYLSLRIEPAELEGLRDRAYDAARDQLSLETAAGTLVFDLEPDVALKEHASAAPPAPMHHVIVATQASLLHAQGKLGAGTSIAVIDDGVDLVATLEGVNGSRVVDGGSFTSHRPEPCAGAAALSCPGVEAGRPLVRAEWSHGTKVATVAASSIFDTTNPFSNATRHSAGIAPEADIVAMRVEDGNNQRWTEDVAAALESLALDHDPGLAAVNLSLGGDPYFPGDCAPVAPLERLVHDLVADLVSQDIAVVVSAGNEGYDLLGFPACLDNVITVACVNVDYPTDLISNWSPAVDVVAPGHGILLPLGPTWGGAAAGGTSMAAPEVAGAIALLRAAYPTCTLAQIKDALLNHATSQAPFTKDGIARPYLLIEDAALWLEANCASPGGQPVEAGSAGTTGAGGSAGSTSGTGSVTDPGGG